MFFSEAIKGGIYSVQTPGKGVHLLTTAAINDSETNSLPTFTARSYGHGVVNFLFPVPLMPGVKRGSIWLASLHFAASVQLPTQPTEEHVSVVAPSGDVGPLQRQPFVLNAKYRQW